MDWVYFLVYDDRYIKTKKKAYDDKVYTNFRGLNVQEYGVEYESFAIISIASLLINRNLREFWVLPFLGNIFFWTIYLHKKTKTQKT